MWIVPLRSYSSPPVNHNLEGFYFKVRALTRKKRKTENWDGDVWAAPDEEEDFKLTSTKPPLWVENNSSRFWGESPLVSEPAMTSPKVGGLQETVDFSKDWPLPETLSSSHPQSLMISSELMALNAISTLMTQIYSSSSNLSPELQTHQFNYFL